MFAYAGLKQIPEYILKGGGDISYGSNASCINSKHSLVVDIVHCVALHVFKLPPTGRCSKVEDCKLVDMLEEWNRIKYRITQRACFLNVVHFLR